MRVLRFVLTVAAIALIAPGLALGDDNQIAQQIVSRLQEQKQSGALKGFTIDLEVEDGTVWMSGRVTSQDQQQKALEIARRIPGVKQVVNDLAISPATPKPAQPADGHSVLTGIGGAMTNALFSGSTGGDVKATQAELPIASPANNGPAIGSGLNAPQQLTRVPTMNRNVPISNLGAAQGQQYINPQPVAMSQAVTVGHQYDAAYANQPVPIYGPGSGVGAVPARYDHPSMPNYSWPSYAAYPNYAAVTYPKQYSPTAWPYIGPFYPYPQVPLGWRKVCLEWDDGWWMLDFKDHRHR